MSIVPPCHLQLGKEFWAVAIDEVSSICTLGSVRGFEEESKGEITRESWFKAWHEDQNL
jgi:hypothetical protein